MRKKAHVLYFEMLPKNLAGRTDPRIRQESESDEWGPWHVGNF